MRINMETRRQTMSNETNATSTPQESEGQSSGSDRDVALLSFEQFLELTAAANGGAVVKGGAAGGGMPTVTPFEIGKSYFVRTITYFTTGECVAITGQFLVLKKAAWIADTGYWSKALANGPKELLEVEPHPPEDHVYINMDAIVDVSDWNHPLPDEVKG
jgi:hypothetical protein